jgi:hypothetical protein
VVLCRVDCGVVLMGWLWGYIMIGMVMGVYSDWDGYGDI